MMRQRALVVSDLPEEVLVYDLDQHKAHCLNQTAAFIWRHCDGKTDAVEMARLMNIELNVPRDEAMVWLALSQLQNSRLLEDSVSMPPQFEGLSRRRMIRNLGIAAVALPLVTSIMSPTAVQAATCFHDGHGCGNNNQCCSGLCAGTCQGG
jgi:hypothetical protein